MAQQRRFTDDLRTAIERSGMTRYEIGKRAGVAQSVLSYFMNGQRGLSTTSIDKLCELLGLRLTTDNPKGKKGK